MVSAIVVELPSSDEEEEKVPEVKAKDLKNPKETNEVKEDIKVEVIEETEKKSGANLLDEWFV